MAKRGRPSEPVEHHLKTGHYRPSKHGPRPTVPDPVEGPPAKPAGLSPEVSAKWDATVPHLAHLLRPYHAALLVDLCRWQVRAEQVEAAISPLVPGSKEHVALIGVAATVTSTLLALSQRFGLSPADRAKMKLLPPAAASGSPAKPKVATRPRTKLDGQAPPENAG